MNPDGVLISKSKMSYNKPKVENICFKLHDGVWYSYTFKKFYCQRSHKCDGGLDLLHSFRTYPELIDHMKLVHQIELPRIELPPPPDYMIDS